MKGEYWITQVEGNELKITHPQKILFPAINLTKWEFISHLIQLAPYLLPYAKDRYLTLIRYPHGVGQDSFYQKNVPASPPIFVHTQKEGKIQYVLLNNLSTLVWLANLNCLEYHTSFHSAFSYHPTELVFDLDPTVPGFLQVIEVAFYTREVLLQLGLDGIVKTSGATGLQVHVPIQSVYSFDQTRQVSVFIAQYLQQKYPHLITLERKVKNRGTKVYFDYLQHWIQKTLITPYSPRATQQATVSTPIGWEELEGASPEMFTLPTIGNRLKKVGDLFAPLYTSEGYSLDEILSFLQR